LAAQQRYAQEQLTKAPLKVVNVPEQVVTAQEPAMDSDSDDDLMDDIQVELSLEIDDEDSDEEFTDSADEDTPTLGYTSPSARVDLSLFMPAPGPPILVANDVTITASAVPISDWVAGCIYSLLRRPIGGRANRAPDWLRTLPVATPESFRSFVSSTFSSTLTSPQCLFLGLLYLSKLPIGVFRSLPAELDNPTTPPGVVALFSSLNAPAWTPAEAAFREELYGHRNDDDEDRAQIVLTLAIMLGNKWLEDNTFTTTTWHDVTDIPKHRLRNLETAALDVFNFNLSVPDVEWSAWLQHLRAYASALHAREPLGSRSVNAVVLGRVDRLVTSRPEHDTLVLPKPAPALQQQQQVVHIPIARSHGHHGHSRMISLPALKYADENEYPHHRADDWTPEPTPVKKAPAQTHHRIGSEYPLVAIHPSTVNSRGGWSRVRNANSVVSKPVSRWEKARLELAKREREQESSVSTWPHPARMSMDWSASGSTSRRSAAVAGM